MARKLKLLTLPLEMNGVPLPDGAERFFNYGTLMKQIIGHAPPQRGLVFAEIEAAVAACAPINAAIEAGAEEVTLTEEQYKLLRDKLETFPWAMAHPAIVDFGQMIRNAHELMLFEPQEPAPEPPERLGPPRERGK